MNNRKNDILYLLIKKQYAIEELPRRTSNMFPVVIVIKAKYCRMIIIEKAV